ncbi:MAG: twin-arginine translocase TatA/TatE family subunit [Acidobacteriia bacterium]|nr:twin-arginine translocase TatA/TatE family subunit [Terriglobia bacterium]
MGPLGWQETIFIFVLALLVFGPKKLPELGKTIGKAMTEFRRASSELKSTWDREMASVERETESLKDVTASYDHQISSSYGDGGNNSYHDSSYESGYEYGYDAGTGSQASADSTTVSASAIEGAELTAQAGESAPATASAEPALQASQVETAEPEPNPVRT